jgi:hypothetical protein
MRAIGVLICKDDILPSDFYCIQYIVDVLSVCMTCSFSKARSLFFSDVHWTIDAVLDFLIKLCGKFTGGSGLCMLELFYLFITVSSEITFYIMMIQL